MSPRKKQTVTGTTQRIDGVSGETQAIQAGGAPESKKDGPGKPPLSRESIIAAAMAILERDGYEALSMRRLGKELGVDPMAVYYHIPNKAALIDALVEAVLANAYANFVDDSTRSIPDRILKAARVYREALLAHPSLIYFLAVRPPRTAASLKPVDSLLGIFLDAGFSSADAATAVNIFGIFVRGAAMRETASGSGVLDSQNAENIIDYAKLVKKLPPGEFPNFARMVKSAVRFPGFEAEFDRGMEVIIRGLLETYGVNKEAKKDV